MCSGARLLSTADSVEDGIALMHEGLAGWRATGAGLFVPFYLALLAEAYGEAGQAAEGLAALDEALTIVDKGGKDGERLWDAELCRIKGELLLGSSHDVSRQRLVFKRRCRLHAPREPSPGSCGRR